MRPLQVFVCCFGLVLGLAPVSAFAATTKDHNQAEVMNAQAQLQLAQSVANDIVNQADQSATNDRAIALGKSEALRQTQLDNASNAVALQQVAASLADRIRSQGDADAQNELAILQLKASALVVRADANLANAVAIGRQDEIANAQAQSDAAHQLANFMTGTLAQQNMSNDEIIAETEAAAVYGASSAEAQNDLAMGADDLLAADTILNDADISAESDTLRGNARAETVLAHAEESLANAEAQDAEATP